MTTEDGKFFFLTRIGTQRSGIRLRALSFSQPEKYIAVHEEQDAEHERQRGKCIAQHAEPKCGHQRHSVEP